MYIYIYVYTCSLSIYIYIYTCIHIHIDIYICVYRPRHAAAMPNMGGALLGGAGGNHRRISLSLYICIYMHIHMHIYIYIYAYVYRPYTHTHISMHIYIYSPVQHVVIQMPSQDNKLHPKSSSKTWRSSWRDSTARRRLALCSHNRSVINTPRKETLLMTLPFAKSVYPTAFSRQQAKPKVIIQDVAE